MKNTNSETRREVADAYAEALANSETRARSNAGASETRIVRFSEYGRAAVEFEAAAGSSFGCGNPLVAADIEAGQTVVDFGSGAGLDLLVASTRVGPTGRVIGVDMTPAMIEAARRNIEDAGATNIELRHGLIEQLPVETATVDWVISNCVINLSPEKQRVFGEIHRVLKPGGRFSISDIVAEDLPEWVKSQAAALVGCVAGAIGEQEYLDGLRQAGLREVRATKRVRLTADEMAAIVLEELTCGAVSPDVVRMACAQIEGQVHSVRFEGVR